MMTCDHIELPDLLSKFKMKALFILVGIIILNSPYSFAKDNVAKDLGSSRELIENKKNKELFDYQIGNTDVNPSDAKLGDLDKKDPLYNQLLELLDIKNLAPEEIEQLSAGLKKLPYQQDLYVGWVNIGQVIYPIYDPKGNVIPEDKQKEPIPSRLKIALIKRDAGDQLKLSKEGLHSLKIKLRRAEIISSFDFAPYNLGSLGRAFGIRTDVNGCGAGGSLCSNEYLKLFVVQNNELTQVFNEAMAYFGDIAGDWHKNGTRDHQIIEVNGILKIINSPNSSIPELLLRAKINGKMKQRLFKATTEANSSVVYRSSDRQIIDLVDEF